MGKKYFSISEKFRNFAAEMKRNNNENKCQ